MTQGENPFEGWAVLELMGHRRLTGYVTEQEIAGAGMLRIDIHAQETEVVTQFYSPSAVYCLTPTTEEIARKMGERLRPGSGHPIRDRAQAIGSMGSHRPRDRWGRPVLAVDNYITVITPLISVSAVTVACLPRSGPANPGYRPL